MADDPPRETPLAREFETHRPRLRAVAGRVLGRPADADDAVQETWLRLARTVGDGPPGSGPDDLGAWLTTVVARVSLSMLRARRARPDVVDRDLDLDLADVPPGDDPGGGPDPAGAAVLSDAVGAALLVVLDTLGPAERLAFVLHDLFGVPFEEVAVVVERSPAAARQLASRARRRVRGGLPGSEGDLARRREVVAAFLAAARDGDFGALLTVLDPDVVLRADDAAVRAATANHHRGAPGLAPELHGADAVARVFAGRAAAARPALVDGLPGAVYAAGGQVRSVFRVVVLDGRVRAVEVVADPAAIAAIDLR